MFTYRNSTFICRCQSSPNRTPTPFLNGQHSSYRIILLSKSAHCYIWSCLTHYIYSHLPAPTCIISVGLLDLQIGCSEVCKHGTHLLVTISDTIKAVDMDTSNTRSSTTWHTHPSFRNPKTVRETQPWSTTRCHRLLRPLKTHISALRREYDLENSERLTDDGLMDAPSESTGARNASKGKIQHTYSKRGRRPPATTVAPVKAPHGPEARRTSKAMKLSKRKAMPPGEIVLPTPIIRRARGQQISSPLQPPVLENPGRAAHGKRLFGDVGGRRYSSIGTALEVEMLQLRSRISPSKFSLYESVLRALYALLTATAEPASAGKGRKSLMAMCLRKVPEYIGELDHWEQQQAEEEGTKSTLQNSEISNEVYEAVEAMLPPDRGCPQLRTIVRAHGLKVVRDAIVEGLIDDRFSLLLVKLCYKKTACLEAEGLLEVILDRFYPKPKSANSTFDEARRLAPLKTLRDFAQESRRPQFMLSQLSKLVSQQQLPLDWLSTREFLSIWSDIVKGWAGNEVCDDMISFAIDMITALSSRAKTTTFTLRPESNELKGLSQQTLLSAITTVASLPLLRQEAGKHSSVYLTEYDRTSRISGLVGYVIHASLYELRKVWKSSWVQTVLDLAAYFARAHRDSTKDTAISKLWDTVRADRETKEGKQHYEAVTALICSLAQSCGRGAVESSHHYLTKFCDQLDSTVAADEVTSRKMRIDCAFLLAERTNDLRDLAFAESFNSTATDNLVVQPTPRKQQPTASSFTGFRWDEGISEWVTATPAAQPHRQSFTRDISWDSDDELCQDSGAELNDDDQDQDDRHSADDGVFNQSGSAKQGGLHVQKPQRTNRDTRAAAATRAGGCAQRLSAHGTGSRKRGLASTGLLSLQSDTEDEEDEDEDEDEGDEEEGGEEEEQQISRRSSGVACTSRLHCALGQENKTTVVSCEGPSKRRRVTARITRRSILRTITNIGHEELSEDELGL